VMVGNRIWKLMLAPNWIRESSRVSTQLLSEGGSMCGAMTHYGVAPASDVAR
jgi:hypothetical protein